jgi:hypothetical protein
MRTRPRWWAAVAQAMVMLPVIRLMLWTRGYRRTMGALVSPTPVLAGTTALDEIPDDVREIASAVTAVARLVPFRSRCLARSIAIGWLSRRRGHPVNVVIGVAPPQGARLPAHAWAEYGAIPLNDTADVRTRYVVISQ